MQSSNSSTDGKSNELNTDRLLQQILERPLSFLQGFYLASRIGAAWNSTHGDNKNLAAQISEEMDRIRAGLSPEDKEEFNAGELAAQLPEL